MLPLSLFMPSNGPGRRKRRKKASAKSSTTRKRKTGATRKKRAAAGKPRHMVKGSLAAKRHMARLRRMRRK